MLLGVLFEFNGGVKVSVCSIFLCSVIIGLPRLELTCINIDFDICIIFFIMIIESEPNSTIVFNTDIDGLIYHLFFQFINGSNRMTFSILCIKNNLSIFIFLFNFSSFKQLFSFFVIKSVKQIELNLIRGISVFVIENFFDFIHFHFLFFVIIEHEVLVVVGNLY